MTLTFEELDIDSLNLRDVAWEEIQRLRVEVSDAYARGYNDAVFDGKKGREFRC